MREFEGRIGVVTGAGSGIGRATCEALARRGCDLALVEIDEPGMEETANRVRRIGRKASLHRADVADRARMQVLPEEVLAEHGHVHILVNNAGVGVSSPFEEQSLDDFDWILGINLWGVIHGCKFFLPLLKREEEAHIVNLSSMLGFVALPEQSAYCVTKFAVRALSGSLRAELSKTGVGVTSVHPGAIRTNIIRTSRFSDPALKQRVARQLEKFSGTPEGVARKIVRAIERNRPRVLIRPESYLSDWFMRLTPVGTQHLTDWGYRRRR